MSGMGPDQMVSDSMCITRAGITRGGCGRWIATLRATPFAWAPRFREGRVGDRIAPLKELRGDIVVLAPLAPLLGHHFLLGDFISGIDGTALCTGREDVKVGETQRVGCRFIGTGPMSGECIREMERDLDVALATRPAKGGY